VKLTIHDACWDAQASEWSNRAIAAGVRWLKVVDDPARAYGVAVAAPACGVIYRKVAPKDIEALTDLRRHPEFSDAQACAEMFVRLADVRTAPNLWVEGANEVKLSDLSDAQWYGKVEAIRSNLLASRQLRAVIGNFATGNPDGTLFRAWVQAYTDNGGRTDALIGLHEYGTIALPAARDGHNLLRHRLLRASAPGFRWAITECGLDQVQVGGQWVGGGWRAPGSGISQEAYWQFMRDFAAELERDTDVVCACVFSYGDTDRWKDYEMNDAQSFNGSLIAAIVADGQQAAPVNCARTDAPDNWTHTVNATAGLRVRAAGNTTAAIICAMPHGQKVRSLRRVGDWCEIDFPTAGWSFAGNLEPRPAVKPPERQLGELVKLVEGDRFTDVSAWQDPNDIDVPVMKLHGYRAMMIRVAVGAQTDPEWHLYAKACQAALMPWLGYDYFSFTATWQSQVAATSAAIDKMTKLPTICVDLEASNPTKGSDGLLRYIEAMTIIGAPLAIYTRQSWVVDNLPSAASLVGHLPLIVANYRRPINAMPALPPGWTEAAAWQHAAGEQGSPWNYARTISGKGLDESLVMASGLAFHAGLV